MLVPGDEDLIDSDMHESFHDEIINRAPIIDVEVTPLEDHDELEDIDAFTTIF